MTKKNVKQAQGGFTLIEIIAVLVILGILAAVATPRFVDLQDDAREKALAGAVAAAQSQASMEYAREILNQGDESSAWDNLSTTTVCDIEKSDYDDSVTMTCDKASNSISIEADYDNYDVSTVEGTFTRPN